MESAFPRLNFLLYDVLLFPTDRKASHTFGVLRRPSSSVVPGKADGGPEGGVALFIKKAQVLQLGRTGCWEHKKWTNKNSSNKRFTISGEQDIPGRVENLAACLTSRVEATQRLGFDICSRPEASLTLHSVAERQKTTTVSVRRDRCVSLFLLYIRADSYTADAKASCTHKALLVNYRRLFLTKTEGADNQRKFPSRCFPVAANYTCNQRYFGLMINTRYKFHSHHRSIMSWGTIKKTHIHWRTFRLLPASMSPNILQWRHNWKDIFLFAAPRCENKLGHDKSSSPFGPEYTVCVRA